MTKSESKDMYYKIYQILCFKKILKLFSVVIFDNINIFTVFFIK